MLRTLLKGLEWSELKDYISPAFFEVMPARQISRQITNLTRTRLRSPDVARQRLAANVPAEVQVVADASSRPPDDSVRRTHGQRLLTLYFHQLYHHPTAFLDLRQLRFDASEAQSIWAPGWMRITWEPRFIANIRALYLGYYGGDMDRFDQAIDQLSLRPARDIFLNHFGDGEQRAVQFARTTFHHSFHEAFMACAREGTELHGDFIGLGIYLACLYEHLEALGLAYDVRTAFHQATADVRPG
ncbi:MAG: hypothetical protein AAFV53_15240 [Myxococcota bacterium]